MRSTRPLRTSGLWPRGAHSVVRGSPRFTASLIGAVGLGVGLALTRAELSRRSARTKRTPEHRPAPQSGRPLSGALHVIALEQLDLAIDSLSGAFGTDSAAAIHETRKAIRRLRTLLRLLRSELGAKRASREDRALRDCARSLAGARDSEVVVTGLDAIVDRHPRLAGKSSIVKLRTRLLAERELARRDTGLTSATREEVLEQLGITREWVRGWRLGEGGFELLAEDVRAIYRDGRQSMRVAGGRTGTAAMHDWRQSVKDLRYATEMLTPEDPRAAGDLEYMSRLARRSDRLAEMLGEEHDLALLSERVRDRREIFATHKRTRKTLMRKIEQRREHLCEEALELGKRLYEPSGKEFVRAVARIQRHRR